MVSKGYGRTYVQRMSKHSRNHNCDAICGGRLKSMRGRYPRLAVQPACAQFPFSPSLHWFSPGLTGSPPVLTGSLPVLTGSLPVFAASQCDPVLTVTSPILINRRVKQDVKRSRFVTRRKPWTHGRYMQKCRKITVKNFGGVGPMP